jgi:hypothetical protein
MLRNVAQGYVVNALPKKTAEKSEKRLDKYKGIGDNSSMKSTMPNLFLNPNIYGWGMSIRKDDSAYCRASLTPSRFFYEGNIL